MAGGSCSCGCGSTEAGTDGEVLSTGCGCGSGRLLQPRTREEEIEYLVETWHAIQRRLAELKVGEDVNSS